MGVALSNSFTFSLSLSLSVTVSLSKFLNNSCFSLDVKGCVSLAIKLHRMVFLLNYKNNFRDDTKTKLTHFETVMGMKKKMGAVVVAVVALLLLCI